MHFYPVPDQATEEPVPATTEESVPVENATEEPTATEEPVPLVVVVPAADGGPDTVYVYDPTLTAGDRVIALLLVVLLIVQIVALMVLLWNRPRQPRFLAE